VIGGATGSSSNDATAAVYIYDPATDHWTAATQMLQPRAYPMVVRLADGSVLVAGGSRNGQPLDTAERYNPSNGTWVAAGRLNLPRTQGSLVLLQDGRALATGGGIEGSPGWSSTASVELFDPTKGVWTIGPPMSVPRARHTATLLPSGDVLVTGGATTFHGNAGSVTASAQIFSPRTNTWRPAASMSIPRYVHQAALLANGRVLVAGGWSATSNSDVSKASVEIYDPVANRWAAAGPLVTARAEFVMVRLPDGRLLAVAGVDRSYHVMDSAELFDPGSGTWQLTGKLAEAKMWPAAVVLADGRVLIAGGATDVGANHRTVICELYAPQV
jgi:N-acetylneuraminic acid mutarotase